MKIAIEGMDGVGKTSVAQRLSKENNMVYIEKPLNELFNYDGNNGKNVLSGISSTIYDFDDEIIKAWFFGMGNLYTFLKYKDKDVVIDRHFASNYFWNGTPRTDSIFKNMIELIGKPDITIVLYASVEARLERLYKRNPNDYDLTDKEKHVLGYDKIIKFLDNFDIPYVVINTESKLLEQVFSEANQIIHNLKQQDSIKKLAK